MYQLLIEAVGRSQARRLYPEHAARLDGALRQAVAQYGFAVKRLDADQFLFACDPGAKPQVRDLVSALDAAATALGEFDCCWPNAKSAICVAKTCRRRVTNGARTSPPNSCRWSERCAVANHTARWRACCRFKRGTMPKECARRTF